MNELEKYKEKIAKEHGKFALSDVFEDIPLTEYHKEASFEDGFNAAIALDLPVKFYLWVTGSTDTYKEFVERYIALHGEIGIPIEHKYQYWIDNIYKPE